MVRIDRRIGLLFAVFMALLAGAGGRSAWLGVVQADDLSTRAARQQTAVVEVPAARGSITDRHGMELAVSEEVVSVAATPYLVRDPGRAAARLAPLLGTPAEDVLAALTRRDTGFAWLARKLPVKRVQKIKRLGIEGLEYVPESRRLYPREWLASQLLGTVGTDAQGLAGLEYAYDDVLRGRPGERRLVRDALGAAIELRETRRARPGAELRLTIDAAIQDRAEAVLAGVGSTWRPKGATAVVMDPRSGDVLALANWPRVDANDIAGAPPYARQNRAAAAVYEPGSTFKAITVAGAIEEGAVEPDTEWDLPPQLQVSDRVIKESHPRGPVRLTTSEIIAQSSNVGTVKIGQTLGKKRFDAWVRRFGFGEKTGSGLPGEETGIVPRVEDYSDSSIGNLPIGQGLAVTPLQIATAYTAIANGGVLRPARLVDRIDGRPAPRPKGRRVISPATAAAMRRMLEGVLGAGGTASEASIPGYVLAGKTGTAQKPDLVYGGYSKHAYFASFVGFAPAQDPRLLVAVMVDEPQGEIYGGIIAAPAFAQITSFALNYLKIAPE